MTSNPIGGFLLLRKPPHISSHSALHPVKKCFQCKGSGYKKGRFIECYNCAGSGIVLKKNTPESIEQLKILTGLK